jgi:hypothetical protein
MSASVLDGCVDICVGLLAAERQAKAAEGASSPGLQHLGVNPLECALALFGIGHDIGLAGN